MPFSSEWRKTSEPYLFLASGIALALAVSTIGATRFQEVTKDLPDGRHQTKVKTSAEARDLHWWPQPLSLNRTVGEGGDIVEYFRELERALRLDLEKEIAERVQPSGFFHLSLLFESLKSV